MAEDKASATVVASVKAAELAEAIGLAVPVQYKVAVIVVASAKAVEQVEAI